MRSITLLILLILSTLCSTGQAFMLVGGRTPASAPACDDGLLANGCFDDGTTGWVASGDNSLSVTSGQLKSIVGASQYTSADQEVSGGLDTIAYTITFDYVERSGAPIIVLVGAITCGSFSTVGTGLTCDATVVSTTNDKVSVRHNGGTAGDYFIVDNIKLVVTP